MTNDDDVKRALTDAGERLRHAGPDEALARAAYENRSTTPVAGDERRSWWPAGIGIGLVAAALVGIFAYRVADWPDAVVLTPVDTAVPREHFRRSSRLTRQRRSLWVRSTRSRRRPTHLLSRRRNPSAGMPRS